MLYLFQLALTQSTIGLKNKSNPISYPFPRNFQRQQHLEASAPLEVLDKFLSTIIINPIGTSSFDNAALNSN